eukprot:s440_g15.t1
MRWYHAPCSCRLAGRFVPASSSSSQHAVSAASAGPINGPYNLCASMWYYAGICLVSRHPSAPDHGHGPSFLDFADARCMSWEVFQRKKQRRMSQARVRQMRPLPAIMASDGSAGSSELLELPEQPRRAVSEHLEESLRGDLESSLECRPIVKSRKRAQTVPSDEQEGSAGARQPEPSEELVEDEAEMCQDGIFQEQTPRPRHDRDNLLSLTFSLPREDVASAPLEDAPNLRPQTDLQVDSHDLDCEMLASLTQGTQGEASAPSAAEVQGKQDTSSAAASDRAKPRKAKAKTNYSVTSATSNTSKPLSWLASLGRRFLPQKGAAAAKVSPEDALVGAVSPVALATDSLLKVRLVEAHSAVFTAVQIPRAAARTSSEAEVEVKLMRRIRTRAVEKDSEGATFLLGLANLETFLHNGHLALVFHLQRYDMRSALKRQVQEQNSGFPLKDVQRYTGNVLLALRALWSIRIIHTDIKPDNLLLSLDKESVKLSDFGCAIDTQESMQAAHIRRAYTSSYRPPEIILGQSFSTRADMWSAGATLFELASGHVLFPECANNAMLLEILRTCGAFKKQFAVAGKHALKHFTTQGAFRRRTKSGSEQQLSMSHFATPSKPVPARLRNAVQDVLLEPFADLLAKAYIRSCRRGDPDNVSPTSQSAKLSERCRLLQRSKLSSRPVKPRGRGGVAVQQLAELAEGCWGSATRNSSAEDEGSLAKQEAVLQVAESWPPEKEELPSFQHRPGVNGLLLGFESKDAFYGQRSGAEVEQELARLAMLLQNLLREFAILKDSVGHLEDETGSEVGNRLERNCLNQLEEVNQDISLKMNSMASKVDEATAAVAKTDKFINSKFQALLQRTDARCESVESMWEDFRNGVHERFESNELSREDWISIIGGVQRLLGETSMFQDLSGRLDARHAQSKTWVEELRSETFNHKYQLSWLNQELCLM